MMLGFHPTTFRLPFAGWCLAAALSLVAPAAARDIELRAYMLDPATPLAEPFVAKGGDGASAKVQWRAEGLSEPVKAPLDGQHLVLHTGDGQLAARVAVPEAFRQVIVVLTPAPEGSAGPPWRAFALDGATAAFPWGTSLAVNLLATDTAVEAGEHRVRLPAGKSTAIPAVKQRDEFNMAQVNFLMPDGGTLVPITERRMQFVDDMRRIFLIYATPGSRQPFITTLSDYKPQEKPGR